jgi:hypothetical protein
MISILASIAEFLSRWNNEKGLSKYKGLESREEGGGVYNE